MVGNHLHPPTHTHKHTHTWIASTTSCAKKSASAPTILDDMDVRAALSSVSLPSDSTFRDSCSSMNLQACVQHAGFDQTPLVWMDGWMDGCMDALHWARKAKHRSQSTVRGKGRRHEPRRLHISLHNAGHRQKKTTRSKGVHAGERQRTSPRSLQAEQQTVRARHIMSSSVHTAASATHLAHG